MDDHGLWKATEILSDRMDRMEVKQKLLCERSNILKRIFDNKYVFWGLTGFAGGLLFWGTWVTTSIYAKDTTEQVVAEKISKLGSDIGQVKQSVKDVIDDLKRYNEKNEQLQEKMFDVLLEIKKNTNGKK